MIMIMISMIMIISIIISIIPTTSTLHWGSELFTALSALAALASDFAARALWPVMNAFDHKQRD
jgi:hypothetical protein